MLAQEWKICIYCIVMMTWFNFYRYVILTYILLRKLTNHSSHTSQDSYTTFMLQSKGLKNAAASRASIWMKTGSIFGGFIIGYLSQFFGRRRAIITSALISCFLIPAWILPKTEASLSASGFMLQFFVQGAWGIIPIHLNELSPPAFRSSFPGLTYQIGNMISSPSTQIVNAIAEKRFTHDAGGKHVKAYGPVMGVATAIIAVGIIFTVAVGPEKRGRKFEAAPIAGAGVLIPAKDIETANEVEEKTPPMEKAVEINETPLHDQKGAIQSE
jgi:MFS family permease